MQPQKIELDHGICYRLCPGKIPGVWLTPSGRLINSGHLLTTFDQQGRTVSREAFTYIGRHRQPYLYCRTAE